MVPYVSVAVLVVTLVLTGFFATVSRISVLILKGIHAYLLPDESEKNSLDLSKGNGAEKEGEVKKKVSKKRREKDVFHEAGAQILRIRLADAQLETRKNFQEFDEAVIYSCLGLVNFTMREILQLMANSNFVQSRGWVELVTPDDRISFIVAAFAIYKLFRLLAKVSYDPQLARNSEKCLYWSAGFVGLVVAGIILFLVPASVVDFGMEDAVVTARKSASIFLRKKGVEAPEELLPVSPAYVKFVLAVAAGVFSYLLSGPALRIAKCFWVGTDQVQWNISVLKRSRRVRPLLNLGIALPLLVTLLWVKPMAEIFVLPLNHTTSSLLDLDGTLTSASVEETAFLEDPRGYEMLEELGTENAGEVGSEECIIPQIFPDGVHETESGANGKQCRSSAENPREKIAQSGECVEPGLGTSTRETFLYGREETGVLSRIFMTRRYDWAAGFGVSEKKFDQIRLWCLFLTGLLQIFLLQVNLQTYCDGAVLVWYEALHQSNVNNTEMTKAKVFLNNYFVCRIALQCFVPGVLVLLMIGLGRTRGSQLDHLVQDGAFFFSPSFVRKVVQFISWWLVFSSAVQTSVTVALFRLGVLSSTA